MEKNFSWGTSTCQIVRNVQNISTIDSALTYSHGTCHKSRSRGRQKLSNLFTIYARVKGDFFFRIGLFKGRKLKEYRKFNKNFNEVLSQILKISRECLEKSAAYKNVLVSLYQEMLWHWCVVGVMNNWLHWFSCVRIFNLSFQT